MARIKESIDLKLLNAVFDNDVKTFANILYKASSRDNFHISSSNVFLQLIVKTRNEKFLDLLFKIYGGYLHMFLIVFYIEDNMMAKNQVNYHMSDFTLDRVFPLDYEPDVAYISSFVELQIAENRDRVLRLEFLQSIRDRLAEDNTLLND